MYNNGDGGWFFIVLIQNLVDIYEMVDGLIKEEFGFYDLNYLFVGCDLCMVMIIIYLGMDWNGIVVNILDKIINGKDNVNYFFFVNNVLKIVLIWRKYLDE